MVDVVLRAVRVDVASATPILLLEEVGGPRVLKVFVGAPEATAIAYALEGVAAPRPMTHDLLAQVIAALEGRLDEVVVTHLEDNTFFAELRVRGPNGPLVVSSRPSDAIAVALRSHAPIRVSDELMDAEGVELELGFDGDDEVDEADLVAQLREFLDTVKPEDFGA